MRRKPPMPPLDPETRLARLMMACERAAGHRARLPKSVNFKALRAVAGRKPSPDRPLRRARVQFLRAGGLSHAQIAKRLRISKGTVWADLHAIMTDGEDYDG